MDSDRRQRVAEAMARAGYAALICRMPEHVVMLTGYQPILGTTFCVVTVNGSGRAEFRLALPKDEEDRVPPRNMRAVRTYTEETMERISTTVPAVRESLAELLRDARVADGAVIGYEGGQTPIATAYTQVGVPGATTLELLRALLPRAHLRDATDLLDALAAVKTADELTWIRRAEAVARAGFEAARATIRIGATEAEIAAATCGALLRAGYAIAGAQHVLPYVHVMAGARAAQAYKAFNLTSNYAVQRGDTVLVQMETGINGYWAELTRAFFAGVVSERWAAAHTACVRAQDAALAVIRDGVAARDADAAARTVMREAGFGKAFKHGLGHGFGFQAINHAAKPVLHPASDDVLRAGMVHNMEPAAYLDGVGGIRLNDNVLVTGDGNERLSAGIPRDLDWLLVRNDGR